MAKTKRAGAIEFEKVTGPSATVVTIAALALGLIFGAAGWGLRQKTLPEPQTHEAIWIEFENLQHAIDAASKLGGSKGRPTSGIVGARSQRNA